MGTEMVENNSESGTSELRSEEEEAEDCFKMLFMMLVILWF